MLSSLFLAFVSCVAAISISSSSLEAHENVINLDFSFNPVKAAYWTGYPHHRRTPLALSADGKIAFLAYLDDSETDVHVTQVDPSTFSVVGATVTVSGAKEAGGLVAHNDGFALLTNEPLPSGTSNAPADSTPVPVLYRYTNGEQTWKTFLGGPGVHESDGLSASPDLNGDLVYNEATGLYGAYFVITDYSGWASGHYGDSIQYVDKSGAIKTVSGASSSWGCSHNTGIAFEDADETPFASICAADQGAIWLNTDTQGMSGPKIANEHIINGATNEAMGGMSGSYSQLARYIGSTSYLFTWVSRGAINLSSNDWLGGGTTLAKNRTSNRNVAIAQLTSKNTLAGEEASSEVGAADGDSQVNWITQGTADCSNAHVAAYDGANALVTWEEIANPICDFDAMGCRGTFSGSKFQLVTNGEKIGDPISSNDVFVAGDMVTLKDGRICWPYVAMTWDLSGAQAVSSAASTKQISIACMNLGTTVTWNDTAPVAASSSSAASSEGTSIVSPTVASATFRVLSSSILVIDSPVLPTTLATRTQEATAVVPTAEVSVVPTTSTTAPSATRRTSRFSFFPTSFPGFSGFGGFGGRRMRGPGRKHYQVMA